jgi:hypothetical protein
LLENILSSIERKTNPHSDSITEWRVVQNLILIKEIDLATAYVACTTNEEDKKTCLILHACRGAKETDKNKKMPDYIHVSPHFITEFAKCNFCPNQELENLLKHFDAFIETHFAGSFIDMKFVEY